MTTLLAGANAVPGKTIDEILQVAIDKSFFTISSFSCPIGTSLSETFGDMMYPKVSNIAGL
jgi:hypothetical protein